MKIGLNLSFAVKRWLEPEYLAAMVKNDMQTQYVQFTWDLIDPWWPAVERDTIARRWGKAFQDVGLELTGTFGGLASYTYPQLMAPTSEQRAISLAFFKRAIDMSVAMGAPSIGTPLGGMTHAHAYDETKRRAIYSMVIEAVHDLAAYGKKAGLKKVVIEPTPLATEFPWNPQGSLQLMKDLAGTEIPVRLLVDWGHALFKPLLKEEADMDLWLETCLPYIDCFHLQQTDGELDRHWSFAQQGIVTPELVQTVINRHQAGDLVQYVEIIYPFEATDEFVREDMIKTMGLLQRTLGEGGHA